MIVEAVLEEEGKGTGAMAREATAMG